MSWLKVAAFVLVLVGLFVWAGETLTRASGDNRRVAPGEAVSVANGELIFWGPGKCSTCHAVGTRGTSVRGPNLGESRDGSIIAMRAIERAAERSAALGRSMTPTEYLVESLSDPSAHVVEGFKDEMPVIYKPPIALEPGQFTSVILYLQSLGGEPDRGLISLPADAQRSAGAVSTAAWEPYLDGDPVRGRELFFDATGPAACGVCHRVDGEGGEIGPDLTQVAGTRTAQFIVESLLEPDANIAGGYEMSLMPGNLAEMLTVQEFHDLLAFLRTLR